MALAELKELIEAIDRLLVRLETLETTLSKEMREDCEFCRRMVRSDVSAWEGTDAAAARTAPSGASRCVVWLLWSM